MVPYPDLMGFWAVCISWSALFLTTVSIYLYIGSRKSRKQDAQATTRLRFVKDFVFVWVLLGLLGLYIVSINRGSSILFASGNLVVEALLIVYTVRNRPPKALGTEEGDSYSPQLK
jgi:hypothetical protein